MDSGWAVVVGASIALVGSAVVPWVRESLTARSVATRKRQRDIAAALVKLGNAIGKMQSAILMKNASQVNDISTAWAVLLELELLLKTSEKDIAILGSECLSRALKGEAILPLYVDVVSSWQRDGVSPAEALARFKGRLKASSPAEAAAVV